VLPADVQRILRETYSDIIRGYSRIKYRDSDVFIKHAGINESFSSDSLYEDYYQKAILNKIPTQEDQLKFIKSNGLWSDAKDNQIKDKRLFIDNLKITRTKLAVLKSQQEQIDKELKNAENEIREMEISKMEHMGLTAEIFASRKANEYNILNSFYKSVEPFVKFFTNESLDELDDFEFSEFLNIFHKNNEKFQALNLKRIAVSPYFLNFFYLCDNNPVRFYGKPVVNLTFYQAELFSQGCYFKNILSEMKDKLPTDIMENPDELVSMYETNKNVQGKFDNTAQGKEMAARGIMGAKKEDYIRMGLGDQLGPDLAEIAAKKGGHLDIHDIIKAHGA
jgi:hypothetical protein